MPIEPLSGQYAANINTKEEPPMKIPQGSSANWPEPRSEFEARCDRAREDYPLMFEYQVKAFVGLQMAMPVITEGAAT